MCIRDRDLVDVYTGDDQYIQVTESNVIKLNYSVLSLKLAADLKKSYDNFYDPKGAGEDVYKRQVKSQSEMIARLTAERAELQRRKMQADRRRQEVFRLPTDRYPLFNLSFVAAFGRLLLLQTATNDCQRRVHTAHFAR